MVALYAVLAALITALANLLIRRGLDMVKGAEGDPFIAHRFLTAAIVTALVIYFRHDHVPLNYPMLFLGAVSGIVLGCLQYSIGRSLQYGPPALSFIVVSAACVIPPLLMFFVFGESFGHGYTLTNFLGSLCVVLGLFWMGKTQGATSMADSRLWLFWAALAFSAGIFYQISFQWRALMLKEGLPESTLLPFHMTPAEGECFLISMFISAALFQMFLPRSGKTTNIGAKPLLVCGIIGGILNGISGFILMRATEVATSDIEKAIVFPLFTVLLISMCNTWAQMLYQERVNWRANALCMAGIVIGSR